MSINLTLFSMDTIEAKKVDWLWYPYIPYGKVTIVQGDPGEGKTTFVLHLAAKLSQGGGLDEAPSTEPLNVIFQTAEDGLADTVKPRLEQAKADCSRILVIDDKERSLTLQDERLEMVSTPKRNCKKTPVKFCRKVAVVKAAN